MRTRTILRAAILIPLTSCLLARAAAGQEPATLSQVDLKGGGSIYGRVIERGERLRIVVTDGDTIDLPSSQVDRVREVRGAMVDGRFMRRDANETRLFFGPTARTLPQGDAYIGVFELLLPFVAVGVTDRITLAGGMPLVFGEDVAAVVYLAPKVQVIRSDAFTASIGSLSFFSPGEESLGVAYAVATAETGAGGASFTAGAGWGYLGGEVANEPVLMVGGDARVSRSVKLLTENYIVPDAGVTVFGFGLRFMGERLSADVGLVVPSEAPIALPVVNFVYAF